MSESSDSGVLSESAMQNELASFDYEIEQINSQLTEAKKQFREFKRVQGKIDERSVIQICCCEMELKLIERRKKFMEEKKITREMLEKMKRDYDYTFKQELVQSYIDLAKSVVSDKAAGKDITNHDFYKEKFFFDLFLLGEHPTYYGFNVEYFGLSRLPEEIFPLAGKEQMENIIRVKSFFYDGPAPIRFGDKLQYLSERQLDDICSICEKNSGMNKNIGRKLLKEVGKSGINFPPESPIYKFLNEELPEMERLANPCCEIC